MTRNKIVLLALFLYLFLAPFTFHPDIKIIFYQSHFLGKGIFNIYSFFAANPDKAFLGNFVYPPLAYFVLGILFFPVKFLAGKGFLEWLFMGNDAVNVPNLFQYLFAVKLPLIFFHFMTGFLLMRFFEKEKDQKRALILWFFNPVSIYVVCFMGQIDILAVYLTLLALYFAQKRWILAVIFLGLGAAIKTYPLLLLPFLVLYAGKSLRTRISLFLLGIITWLIFIIPFLATPSFFESTLVSGLSQRLFELKLYIGFGEYILLIPLLILLLFFNAVSKEKKDLSSLPLYFLTVTFISVSFTHFHPQWALWFLPFLIISVIRNFDESTWISFVFLIIGWAGTILLFEDIFLSFGILSPIDSGVLFLPAITQGVRRIMDPYLLQSFFHTIFVSSGIFIIWKYFKEREI